MHVMGVIDVLQGRAVHARGGMREGYQPVVKSGGRPIPPGDAAALADAYVAEMGVRGIYVADLDAITGGTPQEAIIARLADVDVPVWVDAGVATPAQAARLRSLGVSRVVVGLETLPSYAALGTICDEVGADRVVFSLDVKHREPLVPAGSTVAGDALETIAARVMRLGARTIVALDLARVGSGSGPDVELMARLRAAVPEATLLAGGGVRDAGDLMRLAGAGCDGALVATALLSGELRL